mgnify:CR=1 FL=1
MKTVITLIVAACLAAPAGAWYVQTGNDLLALCTSADPITRHHDRAQCGGYIAGAHHALQLFGHVCAPEDVTAGQVIDMLVQHLRANPRQRHEPARMHVFAALFAAWPCHAPHQPSREERPS